MKINEIITEDIQLDEATWKQRAAAAALAGAGVMGGIGYAQNAEYRNNNPEVVQKVDQERRELVAPKTSAPKQANPDSVRSPNSSAKAAPLSLEKENQIVNDAFSMYQHFGALNTYRLAGWLNKNETDLFLKTLNLFELRRDKLNNKSITDAWGLGEKYANTNINQMERLKKAYNPKQQAEQQWSYIGSDIVTLKRFNDMLSAPPLTPDQLARMKAETEAAATKKVEYQKLIDHLRNLSQDDQNFYDTSMRQISMIVNQIRDLGARHGSSSERVEWKKQYDTIFSNFRNKINQAVKNGFDEKAASKLNSDIDLLIRQYSMTIVGVTKSDIDQAALKKLNDYVKNKLLPTNQTIVNDVRERGLKTKQDLLNGFMSEMDNISDPSIKKQYKSIIDDLKADIDLYKSYLAKSDTSAKSDMPTYKQDQAPAASQSPKSPEAKQANSDAGWTAKTTGNATGLTKNGDKYTGEWKDGFANGNGERTLVSKGYTGELVKTGNKLDTEWKNGMPVDGAKVKVTRPDGTVFNGHIKRGDQNPWKYMIVK
jgi:hypothetical protein